MPTRLCLAALGIFALAVSVRTTELASSPPVVVQAQAQAPAAKPAAQPPQAGYAGTDTCITCHDP